MKALIHNDKIVQIAGTDFPVAPAMSWVDCPEEATTSWKYENGQVLPPDPEPEPTAEELKAQAKASRQQAHRDRSDPIFMQWQRDEATEQEWLDEVAAIRLEFPYPEEL